MSASSTAISLTVRGASLPNDSPQVTSPHGRFTFSLRQFLGQLGREQGGASAARSATLQGMQVTGRAILRIMHSLPLPPIAPPRIIGLDEWAWKRGQRYGALIVDLERKKPIALLADRSQDILAHVMWYSYL
jgi:transposase